MRTKESAADLSATKEDYLRAIYLLTEAGTTAGITSIAKRLSLSKSTVSERIKHLAEAGLVQASPYAEVSLTPAGRRAAEALTYKHRIIEVFLHDVLSIPESAVHAEAEKLEHACSDAVIQQMAAFLQHPTTDPHGTSITKPDQWPRT